MEMNYESQRYPPHMTERSVILSDPGTEKQPNTQTDIQAALSSSQITPPVLITVFQKLKETSKLYSYQVDHNSRKDMLRQVSPPSQNAAL